MKMRRFIFACFALFALSLFADAPKYVFLFIGDGMAVTQRHAAEEFSKKIGRGPLAINSLPCKGLTTTRSANSLVTDSAAAATAIACGEKTKNYTIGRNAEGKNVYSSAVAAKEAGKKVGIISTVTLTHATPAGFYAHRAARGEMYGIAIDLVHSGFDFFAGGGLDGKYKDKKAKEYTGPIAFRDGGTITAFYKENPELQVTMTYAKIEKINTEVVFTSSEEAGEGNASHLTDGDINSIWHTMYSVTVAKYPHWVDFDAGDVKNIKGFIYLPRQDGPNGNIKDYEILVSTDGKNWGEPIMKGTFENNQKEKKVMLKAPVKARYFRFRALSSQNGQDFASGAEFSIIAE